jgi:hypothetical protein
LNVDGNYLQTNNLDVVDKARKNNVAIISVLPLLSSMLKMQALASAIVASFETYYEQEMDTWLSNNPGPVVVKCRL